MRGAKGVLISITGGMDMTLFEVDEAANRIRDEIESEANIIFGSTFDERLNGRLRVSVVATGIDAELAKMLSERSSAKSSTSSAFFSTSQSAETVSKSIETAAKSALEKDVRPDQFNKSVTEDDMADAGINFDSGETANIQGGKQADLFTQAEQTTSDLFSSQTDATNSNVAPTNHTQNNNDSIFNSDPFSPPRKKKKTGFLSRLFGISDEDEEEIKSTAINRQNHVTYKRLDLEESNMVSQASENNVVDEQNSEDDDLDIPAYMRRLK